MNLNFYSYNYYYMKLKTIKEDLILKITYKLKDYI